MLALHAGFDDDAMLKTASVASNRPSATRCRRQVLDSFPVANSSRGRRSQPRWWEGSADIAERRSSHDRRLPHAACPCGTEKRRRICAMQN